MKRISENFSLIDIRKLGYKIFLAFAIGVAIVIAIIFSGNKKIAKHSQVNGLLVDVLEDCRNQQLLSQFLYKNALLIVDHSLSENQNVLKKIDSALSDFRHSHTEIHTANSQLKKLGIALEAEGVLSEMQPLLQTLIRSSYGIQEPESAPIFKNQILRYEEDFLPLMIQLTKIYRQAADTNNTRLSQAIKNQNWLIGWTVLVVASLVFIFSYQIIYGLISKQNRRLQRDIELGKRYESLIQGTQTIVYEQDGDGKYIYLNKAFERLTGYSLEDLNKKPWYEFVDKDYRKDVTDFYKDVVEAKKTSSTYEFPVITASGERLWISQSVDFTFDRKGKVTNAYNVAKDITEKKLASFNEERFKEGLKLLNELNSKSGLNIAQRIEEGLRLCLEFLNLDVGIVSQIWMDEYKIFSYYPTDCGLKKDQKFKLGNTYCDITLRNKGKVMIMDEMSRSIHKDHPCFKNFNLESYIGAAYRVDGKIAGTVNFTSAKPRKVPFTQYDVDFISLVGKWVGTLMEMRENRIQLQEEQNLLKTFVSNAPAAIAMLDKHMNYISASKRWYSDQGIKGDIIGKSHYKVFPEIPKAWKDMHARALNGEIIMPGIEEFVRKDGSIQWLQGEIHPWYTAKEKVGGIIIFTNDLTEFKRQEVELLQAKEEAEKAGRAKEQFLSTMSHEIRTPLNAIIGVTNLLELEHPELAKSNRLKLLKFGSNNLLTLINDILDFQKIESGHLEIVDENINLKELAENILDTWRTVQYSEDVSLEFKYSEELKTNYLFDQIRLTQVLNNLISNALKFTEKGKVELTLSLNKDHSVQFKVKDSGVGIPKDKLETVFETFKQIHNPQQKKGGTGLGLSISKRLVELMGGTLKVASKVGRGTEFSFALPLKAGEANSEKKGTSEDQNVKMYAKVLLAEDNMANQEIAKAFLTRWGVEVEVANNGVEVLDKIGDKSFDLILMDMHMPEMDGYEASRKIRSKDDNYYKKVPIIALTASTLSGSKAKIHECGMDDYLSKPFDPEDLMKKIRKYAGKVGTEIGSTSQKSELKASSFTFLSGVLGDDKEKIREIVLMTVDSISSCVEEVYEAIEIRDVEKAFDPLHKMKSNLAHLDLIDLSKSIPDHTKNDFWKNLPPFLETVMKAMKSIYSQLT